MSDFVTYVAWAGVILTCLGLVQAIMRPVPRQAAALTAGKTLGGVAALLLGFGVIMRWSTPLSGALSVLGCALAITSLVLVMRNRAR